ncbi:DUF6498-containing protein [Tautonia sociabilis]|uniref:Uncharacterized protein n=1 Tax=Tautonia sociabilis TaxID=2080755 RepID=A0A432MLW7_9BACT|nr:DUF6498-containing protein [Tautonia sociabilis]RUL88249.1 hypothetical protein TsocGM_07885 [Tautonia sociabilis]
MPAPSRPFPAAIVVENLAPLVGVLFFGWSVAPVMVVYWIENGLRGLETAARLLLARSGDAPSLPNRNENDSGQTAPGPSLSWMLGSLRRGTGPGASGPSGISPAARVAMTGFFLVHYGLFWAVHGVFVFVLFVSRDRFGPVGPFEGLGRGLPTTEIALAGGVIGGTMVVSLARDLARSGRWPLSTALAGIARAYGRMVVLHVSILAGGVATMMLGSPMPALVLLIVLKTAAELGALRLSPRPESA